MKLPRWLRAANAGIAFAAFGMGALLMVLLVFPVVRLLSRSEDQCGRRTQYLIHLSFRLFVGFMKCLGLIRITRIDLEPLEQPGARIVVANHPSLIDVVILVSLLPQADCVVKQEAWSNPFLRGVVRAAGYIPNVGGETLVEACVERLRAGRTLILFPEGTRSPEGGLRSFQRGVAHIALRSDCELFPIDIHCQPRVLTREKRWHDLPSRAHYTLCGQEPLRWRPEEAGGESIGVSARRLTALLREAFVKRLERAEVPRA